jgi:hypothetical protein
MPVPAIESHAQAYKVGMNTRETQYFLISYRDSAVGFDKSLPKKGMLIYHIDDNAWSENDCENGGTCTSGGFNYMVAIEQPDGSFDLDCGTAFNYGDRGDMYPYTGIDSFTVSTTPNTNTYQGTASGVSITNIGWSLVGTEMVMDVTTGILYPELAYDDSYYNTCYGYGFNDAGFALRMTPGTYPSLVRGLLIMSCHASNNDFQCRIWDDSGPGGTPGSPLSSVHTVYNAPWLAWTYEDFTADSIMVSAGDFWAVYIEYNGSQLASDTDSPWNGRTMTYYAGGFSADNGLYGNYMMRGVIEMLCAGIKTSDALEVVVTVRPNPFREKAAISFSINRPSVVAISVYDVGGRLVRSLVSRPFEAGRHAVSWDGRDGKGTPVGAGIYFYRFRSGHVAQTGKLSLLR